VKKISILFLLTLALALFGCEERTEQTDTGGVVLELAFGSVGVPYRSSVNGELAAVNTLQVALLTINSVVTNAVNSNTSALMDVELEAIEFTYTRVDGGTRVPPPFIFNMLATVPAGGTLSFAQMPIMSFDQVNSPPVSDLLFENGGFDKETGKTSIVMNVWVRAYGRTISNRAIESQRRPHTLELTQ
jgi:hypothetical protein